MSCLKTVKKSRQPVVKETGCIVKTLQKIIKAQNKVLEKTKDCCLTSCRCSVTDLLLATPTDNNAYNTIPVMLTCKSTCQPYFGTGIFTEESDANTQIFQCVTSPILKAKAFDKNNNHCVVFEMLLPTDTDGNLILPENGDNSLGVCDYFPNEGVNNFQETGICMTLDINNFLGITCLDPVRSYPSSVFSLINTNNNNGDSDGDGGDGDGDTGEGV